MVFEYPYLGVILTPSLSWTLHVRLLVSRGNRLFAQSVSLCSLRPRSSLPSCCRASLAGLNSSSRLLLPFACSTLRCGVGWVGRLVLPSHLSSWSLFGQMLSTSPSVGCCPSLVGCTQCLRATDVHFLLRSSTLHQQSQDRCRRSVLTYADLLVLPFQEALVSALVPPLAVSTPGFVHASLSSPGPVSPSEVDSSVDPHRFSRGSSFVVCQPRSRPRCPWPFHLNFTCSSVGARSMGSRSLPWWSCSSSSWPLTLLRVL